MKVFRPWAFQGSLNCRNYFEGWYFKHVSADRKQVWSFIPGIALSRENSRAFIQTLRIRQRLLSNLTEELQQKFLKHFIQQPVD